MSIHSPELRTVLLETPDAVVSARDVVRRYGEGDTAVDALRGVSVDIAPGRLTAVMGPSGSGKSTLMHILAALDRPTSGEVWIAELLDATGLADRRSHRPSELSGGQQQRVAVARALVSKPTVLFADEPTGNLDSQTSAEILGLLRGAVDTYGQTTVMVTHDPRAATIADRVLFLADGVIVKELGRSSQTEILDVLSAVADR